MFRETKEAMKTALPLLILLTVLTGLLYPLAVTGLAQLLFKAQANGSLIWQDDKPIGSHLIGQFFSSPSYFWGRPSATSPFPYNGAASRGSNLGPSNPVFLKSVETRVRQLQDMSLQNKQRVPVDLVTASASGLDPEISPEAAHYQALRIARANNLPLADVYTLIQKNIQARRFGLLGEPRVNVLALNLALDGLRKSHGQLAPKS